ncbi:MAG: CehA/McbA family metallohydrolase [Deltaproteobacteria bacterium]|nr:CehA/McbA family metallohydrolase [Deltaproteobacteria bacterium]
MIRSVLCVSLLSLFAACSADRPGCLDNPSKQCVPAAPCDLFTDACQVTGGVRAFVMSDASERPAGIDAQAGLGDFILQNDFVTAVVDAADHPSQVAVSGGMLIDLVAAGGIDHLVHVSHATGILPRDQVEYTSVEIASGGDGNAQSVIARGRLYGDHRYVVVTRYELRACDRGVRMRTEIYNGGRIAQTLFVADGYFWGDRSVTPFTPIADGGFHYPALDLLDLGTAFRTYPFVSAASHTGVSDASYATVACDRRTLDGFNTTTLSASGTPRTVVLPGDGIAFERMMFVANGAGTAPAQALAMQARAALFAEQTVKVSGRIRFLGDLAPSAGERDASLLFVEGEVGAGVVWANVVPAADGRYEVMLPANKSYSVALHSFGRPALEPQALALGDADTTLDLLDIPRPATLDVVVRQGVATPIDAEIVLVPAEPAQDSAGSLHGLFRGCAPYLGPPHGSSPACNRALAPAGRATFGVPPGDYFVYATHGPTFSLARQRVTLTSGTATRVNLNLSELGDLSLTTALSADFHVHGGRSFDTSIPDFDRVTSFITSGVQVIAATDHDVVGSYSSEVTRLGYGSRLFIMPGIEMTGLVLFYKRDGSSVPKTLGHFNFWPMPFDPALPRNGGPWDELMEPGALYDTMAAYIGPDGVMQLNHPYAESKLGRDEGYASAIGYDVRKRIPDTPNKTPEGQWRKTPKGGSDNLGHHVQEVMNGASIEQFLKYRAFWFSLLRQGIVRAGTANSDTHTLNIEQTGYPRNLVFGGAGAFGFPNVDVASFNAAVRDGRMIGTNGPVILASITDAQGGSRGPSITAFQPATGGQFHVSVRAAPWIPVSELRVIVNGELAKTIPISPLSAPADPFGTTGVVRYEADLPLSELLASDGFVVFEAGMPLPESADLDEPPDGVPDTLDFNGDGAVDKADHESEARLFPPTRAVDSDPRRHIDVVSPYTWPNAFTNPFLVDFAGNGWEAPGL